MGLKFPFGISVQVERYISGATDSHGNPIAEWSTPETIADCALDPGSSEVTRDPGSGRVIVESVLYTPYGVDIGEKDRITISGAVYEVEGIAQQWRNPFTGHAPGASVNLRLVNG